MGTRPGTTIQLIEAQSEILRPAQQKANLTPEATLYDLRDTFASIMTNEVGCPLPVLQHLMGHSSIEMTMKYVKPGDAGDWLHKYKRKLT